LASVLANIFGSPVVLSLEKHVNIAYQCTKKLEEFFEAAIDGDWDKAAKSRDAINALEHEAEILVSPRTEVFRIRDRIITDQRYGPESVRAHSLEALRRAVEENIENHIGPVDKWTADPG